MKAQNLAFDDQVDKFLQEFCEENDVDPTLVQTLREDPKFREGMDWDRVDLHFPHWDLVKDRILRKIREAREARPEIFREGLCYWPGVTD